MTAVDRFLGAQPWPQVGDSASLFVAVPVGSCEQHGPHLPLDTDTRIAVALCERLAATVPDVRLSPPIGIGASGEHAGFPGTLSVGSEVLAQVLVEVVRSANWAAGLVIVNGHGGNHDAVRAAKVTTNAQPRPVLWWWPSWGPGADAHAGRTETSLMLAIAPHLVGPQRPVGRVEPIGMLLDDLKRDGVASVAPDGVLGDATGASAAEGERLLTDAAADLTAAFRRWRPSP